MLKRTYKIQQSKFGVRPNAHIKYWLTSLLLLLLVSCSTPRTRYSDPVLRIAIDADSIDSEQDYARLQNSLVDSGFFVVVDRSAGFRAVNKEQEMTHQDRPARFGKNEKYARWGRLYGIGGIIVATQECQYQTAMTNAVYRKCRQDLALINATTGETMAVSEAISESENGLQTASWDKAVDLLIQHYPKSFIDPKHPNQTIQYKDNLKEYREKIGNEE